MKMKKLLILVLMFSMLFCVSGAMAIDTSTNLSSRGDGNALLSSNHAIGTQSARLYAPLITDTSEGPFHEGRVRINMPEDFTLNQLNSLSWQQYVTQGYIAHVDVLIDTDNDGKYDDALVFEYDKVTIPSDQSTDTNGDGRPDDVSAMGYGRNGWVNTFDNKGIVNCDAIAWLNSGASGGLSSPGFTEAPLSEWKYGTVGTRLNSDSSYKDLADKIRGDSEIIALEIEVDGWIVTSESYIDDVMINGNIVASFEGQDVEVEIDSSINVVVNPPTLNFGTIVAGTIDNPALNGPVSFDASGSNVNVRVEVTDITEGIFENGLKFDEDLALGQTFDLTCDDGSGVCAYELITTIPTLDIPTGTPRGTKTGTITYTLGEAI